MITLHGSPLAAPFRGLAPFGESELDALLFFGRERETEVAVANLLAARLTILYGPSGVGKSSLLRAGVARRIRELSEHRAIGRGPDGAVVVFASWADDPVDALASAIADEVTSLVKRPVAAPPRGSTLADIVEHWTAVLDGGLYLVLDQFEEYFVYHEGVGQGSLESELPEVVQRSRLRANVLLSLRDDALAQLDVFKTHLPNLFANSLRLDRLDHAAARAAILGPVERWNELVPPDERCAVEPSLVEHVLVQAAVTGEPERIEPPYLQLVMERLWAEERSRGSSLLRASTLAELGGAGAIVREHLDRAMSVLGEDEKDASARMFEHLVTPSGTKVAHRATDLAVFAQSDEASVGEVLSTLRRERILRPLDEGVGGGVRYEIFHDVLADAIIGWRRRREVERARAAARGHQRRLVVVALGALVGLLVMAAITVYALSQRSTARSQSRAAEARALAASALTQLDRDPELSLLLARQAASLSDSPLVEQILRRSILDSRVRRVVPAGGPVSAAVFQRGGRRAIGLTDAGRVVVADPATGKVVRTFSAGSPRSELDPTGRHVLVFGHGRRPRVFDVASGKAIDLKATPVAVGVFSPDGTRLLTLADRGLAQLWDVGTGRLLRTFGKHPAASVAALSPDGRLAAIGGAPGEHAVVVFDAETGRRLITLPESADATHIVFSPGSRLVAVAGADKLVRLQNVRTGAGTASFAGQVGSITDIAFSPRGTLVATSSTDGTARVWRTSGAFVTPLIGHQLYVSSVAFSSDGQRLVTASTDGTARVWRAADGGLVAVLAGHREPVTSAVFSRNGREVVTGGADGTMRFWYAVAEPTLGVRRQLAWRVQAARAAGARIVVAPRGAPDVSVSADASRVATAVGSRVIVRRASGAPLATFRVPSNVTGIALAPDGQTVAVGDGAGSARIYGLDGRQRRLLHGGHDALTRLAFSPDGTLVAAGSRDHSAKVWNLGSGRLTVFAGHTDVVWSARFSPDGSRLVTASKDHDLRIWQVSTATTIQVLRGHFGEVKDAAFSPDGRWVVSAGPGKAGLWDARTGELLFFLQGHEGPLTSASFAADSRTIITSGVDKTVRSAFCDVCVGLDGLRRLADERLTATHRRLSPAERRSYLQ